MIVKYSRLDRDLEKGLYLDFKLLIEQKDEDKIIEIIDEDGTPVYTTDHYVKSGEEIYDTAYIKKEFFKDKKTTFKFRAKNKDNYVINLSSEIIADTYKIFINNIEVKPIYDVNDNLILYKTYIRWGYNNFSYKDIIVRTLLYPIKDEDKDISYDSLPSNYLDSRYISSSDVTVKARTIDLQTVTVMDVTPNRLFIDNNNLLKTSIVLYKMAIRNIEGKDVTFFPEKGAFRYKASNLNEAPIIKLDNMQILKKGKSFQLKIDSILRDSNLDDVKYVINDNQGNVIFQEDYYTYTPRIDKIVFDYNFSNFTTLFLKLNAEVSDNLNFSYKRSFSFPLFKVFNLRIRRDRLLWDVQNYSNNPLKTNVEILDMNNNVIYTGDTVLTRLEKDPITVTDDREIQLLQSIGTDNFYKYYKFRIKVRCEDENYTGYVEFKNGTLVSTQHHNPAEIIVYKDKYPDDYYDKSLKGKPMDHLLRDEDNNKKIKLIFDIEPLDDSAIGDYCKYVVSDDSGNVIYSSKDNVILPQRVEVYAPYDFTKKLYNNINVKVSTEYDKVSEKTIILPSYYIREAKVVPDTQKISLIADNYYIGDIKITAEAHDMYNEGPGRLPYDKIGDCPIIQETELVIKNTDETIHRYMRFVPKIYYDTFGNPYRKDALKCRLKIEGDNPDDPILYDDRYILVEGLLKPILNSKPSVMINYSDNKINKETNQLTSLVNITFGDGDGDWISYNVCDSEGEIVKSNLFDTGIDNCHTITAKKTYDLNTLESSLIQWNISCFDEEGLYDGVFHKIPLHYISNLIFENNNIQYKCRLYTQKSINTILEILDDEGYLYAKGKNVTVNYMEGIKVVEEAISIKNFKPGNYRYRIKVTSKNENWSLYYPNMNGEVINITQEMIDLDRAVTPTMKTSEVREIIYKQLTELTTLLDEKIQIGSYKDNKDTILGRLSINLKKLTNEKKPQYIKELLDLFSNYHDNLTVIFNGGYGEYLLKESFEENNFIMEGTKSYTNHAMPISNYTYNIDGYPLEFDIIEKKHLPFDKYNLYSYVNGRKVIEDKTNSIIVNDGLSNYYLGVNTVPKFSVVEIESNKNFLDDIEETISTITIDKVEKINSLMYKGITIENVSQYFLGKDITVYAKRNNKRINLFRYSINKQPGLLNVVVKDSLYLNDEIIICTNSVKERQHLNSDMISGGRTSFNSTVKPIYFIPLSFIDSSGNIIDMSNEKVKYKLNVYVNGYLAVPDVDYIVIPSNHMLDLPPIILFKDLLFNNSDIEIYYDSKELDDNSIFVEKLPVNGTYYYLKSNLEYPLIKGTFSVYSNNKKIPDEDIIVLNSKLIAFKKNAFTTRVNENFYLKLNLPNNPIVSKLLELYKTYPSRKDSEEINDLLLGLQDKDKLLATNNKFDKDEDYLKFLKYIYELEGDDFEFTKEMKSLLSQNSELKKNGIDCSKQYFSCKDVKLCNRRTPALFNHNLNIFASSCLFENNNLEDNITISNPSRLLQLDKYLKDSQNIIDCSVNYNDDYNIFLNEGIDIEMDFITGDIELNRNK